MIRSDVPDREGARPIWRLAGSIEFRDMLFEYQPGRPVLSHVNLAIAPGASWIVVLDRGRIVEAGAHAELMARN